MNHIVALASAQRLSAEEARSALPNSPIRLDRPRSVTLQRVAVTVRRLTDRLESALAGSGPVAADDRSGHHRREATPI